MVTIIIRAHAEVRLLLVTYRQTPGYEPARSISCKGSSLLSLVRAAINNQELYLHRSFGAIPTAMDRAKH